MILVGLVRNLSETRFLNSHLRQLICVLFRYAYHVLQDLIDLLICVCGDLLCRDLAGSGKIPGLLYGAQIKIHILHYAAPPFKLLKLVISCSIPRTDQ